MSTKTRRFLIGAALAGFVTGTTSALTAAPNSGYQISGIHAAKDKVEKHCCAGKNSCKGKGGCGATKGKNDCKGKGGCSTKTSCKGEPCTD